MQLKQPSSKPWRAAVLPGCLTWTAVLAVLAAVLGALALFLFDPAGSAAFPPCPFRLATGWHCPGCGSLRAAHLLLHGDLPAAFKMNPLMVLSIPLLAALRLRRSLAYSPRTAWGALALIVVFGVARNLPSWPFFLLAPH